MTRALRRRSNRPARCESNKAEADNAQANNAYASKVQAQCKRSASFLPPCGQNVLKMQLDHRADASNIATVRILLAEYNAPIAGPARNDLKNLGHDVTVAASGVDTLYLAASQEWELLIFDSTASDLDALGVIRTLRNGGVVTPVLLLKRPDEDASVGIEAGADDFLDPGFSAADLAARVTALGRRPRRAQPETLLRVADLEIDTLTRSVKRGGKHLELQPREFRLLEYLVRNIGTVLGRTMLLENVWDYHFDPRTNVVESHISRLRAKIDRGFTAPLIHTIRGSGYCIREPD